ncbi:MAG: MotA/TolQ/ExbB proton channel family protein [Trueperaceae bacterium]
MQWLINGGPVMIPIVLISLYAVYVFFDRLFKLNREKLETDALMLRVNAAVKDRDLESALAACDTHGGPVARVLKAALLKLPYGRAAVEAAFQESYLVEESELSRGLRPLHTIAQIATLLGLLGTVTGMIQAFNVIALQGTGDPGAMAAGISEALITTASGLSVAIPVVIGQNYLSSRVDKILLEIERRREELMSNVAQAVAGKRDRSDIRTPTSVSQGDYETVRG